MRNIERAQGEAMRKVSGAAGLHTGSLSLVIPSCSGGALGSSDTIRSLPTSPWCWPHRLSVPSPPPFLLPAHPSGMVSCALGLVHPSISVKLLGSRFSETESADGDTLFRKLMSPSLPTFCI